MTILVTGSSGMIGTRFCQSLEDMHAQYIGFDQLPNRWDLVVEQKTIHGDLTQLSSFEKIPKKIDMIVHLAARARVITSIDTPYEGIENILSTYAVLEFARMHKISKIVFASSKEVYGSTKEEFVTEEHATINAAENPYAASKVASEALLASYQRCYKIDSVVLRFSNVYGMYDTSLRFIPLVIQKTLAGEPVTVYGKGKKLDFVFLDDVVTGVLSAVKNFALVKNNVYNLGIGQGVELSHVARTIQTIMHHRSKITIKPNRKGEVMEYVADISKAKKMLKYTPQFSIEEGLKKTIDWYHAIRQ